jgi:hypothetical protein
MKWEKIEDRNNPRKQLPLDKPFFAIWKGAFCIGEYNEEDDRFHISYLPAQYQTGGPIDEIAEGKFYYICKCEYPEDY